MKFLNNSNICLVCFEKPEEDFNLIKHHVSYYPEVIAHVHYKCHKKIHDTPIKQFIQYRDGDSRKFYEVIQND